MKSFALKAIAFGFLLSVVGITGCKKSSDEEGTCQTCRALSSDGVIEEEVCSEAEETAFRNKHSGREVTCN